MPSSWVEVWASPRVSGWRGAPHWSHEYVRDAKTRQLTDRLIPVHPVYDLTHALQQRYTYDAHFVPYFLTNGTLQPLPQAPRVNKECWLDDDGKLPGDHQLWFSCAPFDIDDDEGKRAGQGARPEWRQDEYRKIAALPQSLQATMTYYESGGGYRLIWALDVPVKPQAYADLWARLRERLDWYDIAVDANTTDVQRCYRLPYATRADGKPGTATP